MAPSGKRPHVLIIGGGLGGLVLAQALRKQQVTYEVFDRDEALHARSQGWCIGIHSMFPRLETAMPADLPGIETTSHLLPLDLPAQLCFYGGGRKFLVESREEGRVIRANRARLRDWLATNIRVTWDKKAVEIQENDDKVTVRFADGTSATGDVLSTLQAIPQGVIVAETTVNASQLERQLAIAHSAYVALGDGFFVFVGLKAIAPDGQSATYYWFVIWNDAAAAREPETYWTARASKEEMYDFALKKSVGLDPRLTEIIRLTGVDGVVQPPLVIRDLVLAETGGMRNSRVTLLGDAAHPMTPFRGEGGSNAIIDALNLAQALSDSSAETVVDGLKGYQDEMLRRGGEAVKRSRAAAGGDDQSRFAWGQPVRPGPGLDG